MSLVEKWRRHKQSVSLPEGRREEESYFGREDLNIRRLKNAGFIVLDEKKLAMKDHLRMAKKAILSTSLENDGDELANLNIVMVTSAIRKEGKTFIAGNLALSMAADLDTKVILMEGDVFLRGTSRQFRIKREYGYLDVLARDDLRIEDVLVDTNIPHLTFLPCGTATDSAFELICSSRMHMLMGELAHYSNTIVVIDAPALLTCSEASALAVHAGQIIFAIGAGRATRNQIEEALSYLPSSAHVCCILNQAKKENLIASFGSFREYFD